MRRRKWRQKFSKVEWWWKNRICRIYCNMIDRCNNPMNKYYERYWWRWIKCLWSSIDEFVDDMYESYVEHCKEYWEKETTLDRIDNNWDYCKDNCRWATLQEQMNNKCTNIYVIIDWVNYSSREYAEAFDVDIILARQRIKLFHRWKLSLDTLKKKWKKF